MPDSLGFILGLLERADPAHVAQEDFDGGHRRVLRHWQRRGFLSTEPGVNPVASCPRCRAGVPYQVRGRYVCNACGSRVDVRHLLLWRFSLATLLRFLARKLELRGEVRRVDDTLWQLGSFVMGAVRYECFFCRTRCPTDNGRVRLLAYRNVVLLRGTQSAAPVEGFRGTSLPLAEILQADGRLLRVTDLRLLLGDQRIVRFDEAAGALCAGDELLGEVPVGSNEHALLTCLWRHLDRYVAYSDLRHFVLERTGSRDETDEATFCQRLKSRIKKRWVPRIDSLIATTNKGDGYRLRGAV